MTGLGGDVALSGLEVVAVATRGPLRGWLPAPRRVRVDARGVWHVQQPAGGWLATVPDRLALGPGGHWLRVCGPVCARTARAPRQPRRVRATLWRSHYDARTWRRLQVAARWRATHSRREDAA